MITVKITNMILTYLHTLKHLKPIQLYGLIRHRLFHIVSKPKLPNYDFSVPHIKVPFLLRSPFYRNENGNRIFTFLNRTHEVNGWKIDEERLWCWNLAYFEYLAQEGLSEEEGYKLIIDWCTARQQGHIDYDLFLPYPSSLRSINWLKFLALHLRSDIPREILETLLFDLLFIARNPEIDLLANHYLANICAVLMGMQFFSGDEMVAIKAQFIQHLHRELNEQINSDGAHFERSLMYHSIILEMLVDLINIGYSDEWLVSKTRQMAMFLSAVCIEGKIPLLNDSAYGIATEPFPLLKYCHAIIGSIESHKQQKIFRESNIAILCSSKSTVIVDGGGFVPYQPGHAHSSALSFEMWITGSKFLTDSGCGTYLPGVSRQYLKSSRAHNTVSIDSYDQHEFWGAFRMGRRGKVFPLRYEGNAIIGEIHAWIGYHHKRRFVWMGSSFEIHDFLTWSGSHIAEVSWHFTPHANVVLSSDGYVQVGETVCIRCDMGRPKLTYEALYQEFNKEEIHPVVRFSIAFFDSIEIITTICVGDSNCISFS